MRFFKKDELPEDVRKLRELARKYKSLWEASQTKISDLSDDLDTSQSTITVLEVEIEQLQLDNKQQDSTIKVMTHEIEMLALNLDKYRARLNADIAVEERRRLTDEPST